MNKIKMNKYNKKAFSPVKCNQRLLFSKAENFTGFTLIELLIVIGIIAILASAVIVAINPGQQFAAARDATRERHINSLHNSLLSYQVSNQGNLTELSLPTEPTEICNTNLEDSDCTDMIDLSLLVDEGHINQLPVDPQATGDGTGYEVAEGSIILAAPLAETRFIGIGITKDEYAEGGSEAAFCEDSADYGTEGEIDGDVVWCDDDGNLWSPSLSGMGDASDSGDDADTFEWGCYDNEIDANSDKDGAVNTDTILDEDCMDEDGGENVAAKACDQLTWAGSDEGDWYLPARYEYEPFVNSVNTSTDGSCPTGWSWEDGDTDDFDNCEPDYDYNAESERYWLSTEYSSGTAWNLYFSVGGSNADSKDFNSRVRCVRR